MPVFDYLNPDLPANLARVTMPVVDATRPRSKATAFSSTIRRSARSRSCAGRRRARGRSIPTPATRAARPKGRSSANGKGDILYGRNAAVGGHYILAYGEEPGAPTDAHARAPKRILLWHANYHPDGGQLFFPLDRKPFLVPLALPGDDVLPGKFVCFRFDGSRGLYIHPNIWHEGVFATAGTQRFFDQQGAVHARVSVDFAREFGCLLEAPIG